MMEIAWIAALGSLVGAIVGVLIMKTLGGRGSSADVVAEKSAEAVAAKLAERFNRIDSANERTERELRSEISGAGLSNRQELSQSVAQFGQSLGAQMTQIATVQNNQIDGFAQQLIKLTDANEARLNALQKAVDERLAGFAQDARNGREESANTLKRFGDALNAQLTEVRATLEARLKDIETLNGV